MRRTRPRNDPDAGWVRITWDEALDWTAERMRAIADREGPEAVAFTVTTPAGTAISDGFPWINRLIRAFGSPNMVWARSCARGTATTPPRSPSAPTSAPRTSSAPAAWSCGANNPSSTYLAQATAVTEAATRGTALIVVDPRRAGPAARADQWLRVRPGTDGALALGLASVMIAEGWYDRDFRPRLDQRPAAGAR